jgi:putative transposase
MPQSLSCVLVHLVFSTKNRHAWLTPEIEPELHPYLASVFRACESPALTINGTTDHVHCLFQLARTQPVCDVVEEVKKRSSK